MQPLHDAADAVLLDLCGKVIRRCLPADDRPAPLQPDASTTVDKELKRSLFVLEGAKDRAAVHDLPAALIGEPYLKSFAHPLNRSTNHSIFRPIFIGLWIIEPLRQMFRMHFQERDLDRRLAPIAAEVESLWISAAAEHHHQIGRAICHIARSQHPIAKRSGCSPMASPVLTFEGTIRSALS